MLVPDDTTAAGQRRAESAQPEIPSAGAGAMSTPRVAPAVDAVAGAPPQGALAGAGAREEPPCLRDHLLPMLNLPSDLPAHFIGEKTMRRGDVSPCYQRLFLPGGGGGGVVLRRLLEILLTTPDPEELSSVDTKGAKRKRMEATEAQAQCGGLPVKLVSHRAGAVESRIMRLRSVDAAVIRGKEYLEFVRRCGFKESDVVEIWAFRGTSTTSGCSDDCRSPLLHVLITKKDESTLCSHCSLPMCSH